MVLRELFVSLGLDLDAQSFAKGELAAEGIIKVLELVVDVAKEVAESFVEMVKGAVETSDELYNTSQAIGVTTDALQELQYAGLQSNIGADELTTSIRMLSRTMYEAKAGTGAQAEAFQKLGVHVNGAGGKLKGADEVIGELADKFQKLPNGAEKTALSLQLFGRAGARMVPLLNQGAEGIADLRKEAHELGFVLDEEVIKQGAEVDELGKSLKAVWTGIKNQVGSSLFPILIKTGKAMREWLLANREWIKQGLERILKGIAAAGKFVYETFALIARNADLIKYGLAATVIAFAVLKAAAIEAAAATLAAWLEAAAPFIAIGAAIAGLLLFIDDLRMYAKYGDKADTITGQFVKSLKAFEKPGADDPWWLRVLKDFTKTLREAIELLHELEKPGGKGIVSHLTPTASAMQPSKFRTLTQAAELAAKPIETLTDRYRPSFVKRADVRGQKALEESGSYWEGLKATFGFGQYGNYEPPTVGSGGSTTYAPSIQVSPGAITVNAAPGQSAKDIAEAVQTQMDGYWDGKMEEAAPGGSP